MDLAKYRVIDFYPIEVEFSQLLMVNEVNVVNDICFEMLNRKYRWLNQLLLLLIDFKRFLSLYFWFYSLTQVSFQQKRRIKVFKKCHKCSEMTMGNGASGISAVLDATEV